MFLVPVLSAHLRAAQQHQAPTSQREEHHDAIRMKKRPRTAKSKVARPSERA